MGQWLIGLFIIFLYNFQVILGVNLKNDAIKYGDDETISSMYHINPNSLEKFTEDKATHNDNDFSQRNDDSLERKDDDDNSMDKRNIVGFQGVRGKKFLLNYPIRYIPKRAPSGFLGMRGKKLYEDRYSNKRAPSGFLGMRGKKSENEPFDLDEFHDYLNYLVRNDNGPNYRTMSRYFNDYDDSTMSNKYLFKRAMSGFLGVRGKRDTLSSLTDALQDPDSFI